MTPNLSPDVSAAPASAPVRPGRRDLFALGALTAAVLFAYAPNLRDLAGQWAHDPHYTHGFLVAPIAAAILWRRRERFADVVWRPRWLGFVALGALLVLRTWLYERNEAWFENLTLLPVVVALVYAFGSWKAVWAAAPGLAFLVFLFPLPARINAILAGPLQTLATLGSGSTLRALGVPVLVEGHVLQVGADTLEVAQACNGLAMLLTFIALISAVAILIDRPIWERLVLLASAIPIALIANILRIVLTAICYRAFGAEKVEAYAHDVTGWLMMPLALGLVWLELSLLSLLIVEDRAAVAARAPRAPIVGMRSS